MPATVPQGQPLTSRSWYVGPWILLPQEGQSSELFNALSSLQLLKTKEEKSLTQLTNVLQSPHE